MEKTASNPPPPSTAPPWRALNIQHPTSNEEGYMGNVIGGKS
jgi:hypothetical protein